MGKFEKLPNLFNEINLFRGIVEYLKSIIKFQTEVFIAQFQERG